MLSTASTSQLGSTRLKWPVFVGAWLLTALLALILGLLSSIASIFAVIIVVTLLFSVLALFNYRIGVVLLVLLLPIANTSLFPHELLGVTGLNPFNLLLLLTLMSYFLPRFMRREAYTLFPAYFYGLYLLPVLVAGLIGTTHVGQIPFSMDFNQTLNFDNAFGYFRDMVIRPLFTLIVAYLIAAAVRDSKSPERFLGLGFSSVVVLVIMEIGVLQWRGLGIFALAENRSLLSVLGMHANQVGPFLGIAFGIALFIRAACTGFAQKMLVTVAILFCVVGGVLSFSRGGMVIFFVTGLIYLVSRRSFKQIAISVLFVAIAGLLAPTELYERITRGWGTETRVVAIEKTDELSAGRGYIWSKIIPGLAGSLVTGGGINSILWSPAVRAGEVNLMAHPHNAYLHTLMDFGLLGGTLLVLFFRRLYKQWVACSRDEQLSPLMRSFFRGVSASFVGYLFFAFTSSGAVPDSDQFFLWAAMGILYGMLARTRKNQRDETGNSLENLNMIPRSGTVL